MSILSPNSQTPETEDNIQQNDTLSLENQKSDPIVFARTETINVPYPLKKLQIKRTSNLHLIYQTDANGNHTSVSIPLIQQTPQKISFAERVKRMFKCCQAVEDAEDPNVNTMYGGEDIPIAPFLKEKSKSNHKKRTLVLDLDETLVHSSFKPYPDADHIVDVEIENNVYHVYVYERPHASEFIKKLSKYYEIVIYTASLKKYAFPLLNEMDREHHIFAKLFRDHCVQADGIFVKDLSFLGRDLSQTIMVDNSAASFQFQPRNGIECTSFIDDKSDKELYYLEQFLTSLANYDGDVRQYLHLWPVYKQKALNKERNLAVIDEEAEA